jgi:hypothetical protein
VISLRTPPDLPALSAAAERYRLAHALLRELPYGPPAVDPRHDQRGVLRWAADAVVYLGQVPRSCERLELDRVPVSVFKPLVAGWTIDVSLRGVGLVSETAAAEGARHWLGLHELAHRPLILPVRVQACEQLPDGLHRVALAFMQRPRDLARRLGAFQTTSAQSDAA